MLTGTARYEIDFTDFIDVDWTEIEKEAFNVWFGVGYDLNPN